MNQNFANLAYCEPFYLKAFYSAPAKKWRFPYMILEYFHMQC